MFTYFGLMRAVAGGGRLPAVYTGLKIRVPRWWAGIQHAPKPSKPRCRAIAPAALANAHLGDFTPDFGMLSR